MNEIDHLLDQLNAEKDTANELREQLHTALKSETYWHRRADSLQGDLDRLRASIPDGDEERAEQEAALRKEVQTLKLALQACQNRIALQDAALTGIRLLLEGTAHAQGQR